uniref:Fungal lipase-type domain-containing protein n=1 Tax=Leptocylindrus danicus TaxID=163516 RepID=A0A7S2K4E4_9STRA
MASKDALELSTEFPDVHLVNEYAELSELIYGNSKQDPNLPFDWELEFYEDRVSTGNVMVISSFELKQIGIIFAGSDGVNDWLDDMDITQEPFGPKFDPINKHAWVHSGFNNVLFFKRAYEKKNMFDRIESTVYDILDRDNGDDYEVFLSGHSLGAALSVLLGAGLAHNHPDRQFTVINFGCPRVGSKKFKRWSNSLENLGVWRFVFHKDVVARLPSSWTLFYHTGHTIQLEESSDKGAQAYYLHGGDKELNFAGVPSDWDGGKSADNHYMSNYLNYLQTYSMNDTELYYVSNFEEKEVTDSLDDVHVKKESLTEKVITFFRTVKKTMQ